MKERRPGPETEADGIIEGRNAVIEALRAGTPVDKIYLARGETDSALGHIASTARGRGIEVNTYRGRTLEAWREILVLYRDCGGEIVTVGSDAHIPAHVGRGIAQALELVKACGFPACAAYEKRVPIFHTI